MKWTVARRLHATTIGVAAVLAISAGCVWMLSAASEDSLRHGGENVRGVAALADAQSAIWGLRWGVAQYIAVQSEADRAKIVAASGPLRAEVDKALQTFEPLAHSEQERRHLQTVKENFARYAESRERWLKLYGEGKVDEAVKERAERTTPFGAATVKGLAELIQANREQATREHEAGMAALTRWTGAILAFIALAAVAGAVGMGLIARSISGALRESVAALKRIAQGDLTLRLPVTRRDELGDLMRGMNETAEALSGVVADVRQSVDSVSTASAEIAAGNQDLSARTEQQAGSLQQTAASMEQLTGTVRQSADNARQANQLAGAASQAAEKGGAVVGQVVSTMEEITASSRKIADIIAVIDGIAFQTNILALNAAVEAARAGEQGRGFAVVAGEVRNLAQRSAQAAREIKALIGDSVEKVASGGRLVNEAGASMAEIVAQVKRVSDLIGEITSASAEQSSGIGQINDAVTQMDRGTQQNAALVEQSAAAAHSLREQAERLAQAVAVFRLAQGETRQAIAQAQASSRAIAPVPVAPAPPVAARAKRSSKAKPAPAGMPKLPPAASAPADADWKEF